MKTGLTRLTVLALVLAGSLGPAAFRAAAEMEISAAVQIHAAADFYEPLAPNGAWVVVGHYGRCWHPTGVAVGWQPYCDGTWLWTDCGWYWQSDEPWSWACYHYGTWIFDPDYGWVWIPGVEWAPCWVYWRIGGGYIGWAPCSPRGGTINARAFVFVDEGHFHERHRAATVIVNNQAVLDHTRQTGGNKHVRRTIGSRQQIVAVNSGPDVSAVEKATGKKVSAISIQEADLRTAVPLAARHRRSEPSPAGIKTPAAQEQTSPSPDHQDHPPRHQPEPGFPAFGPEERNNPGQGHEKDREQDR